MNSITAVTTASVRPAIRTTKMPPTFSIPRDDAFDSFCLSSLLQVPVFFHHLLYSICIRPFSCRFRITIEIESRYGEPVGMILRRKEGAHEKNVSLQ